MMNPKRFFFLLLLLLSLNHYNTAYNTHTPFHQHLAFNYNQPQIPNAMHVRVKNYTAPSYCIKKAMAVIMHSVEQLYIEKYPCVTLPVNATEPLQRKEPFSKDTRLAPLPVAIGTNDSDHNECPIETKRYDAKSKENNDKRIGKNT